MLIGFGSKDNEADDDESVLKKLGCERSYFWADRDEGRSALNRVLEFLRPGDTMVIVDFDRLETEFGRLLQVLEHLHGRQIRLHVHRHQLIPGTPAGETFLQCSAILAAASRLLERPSDVGARAARTRGRPHALSSADQIKVRQMLLEKGASVLDVARKLHVSPATIYRYSPRRRKDPQQ